MPKKPETLDDLDTGETKRDNYIAIVSLKNGDTVFPERIEGNTKDSSAVIVLSGHYKDSTEWEIEALRSDIGTIKRNKYNEPKMM